MNGSGRLIIAGISMAIATLCLPSTLRAVRWLSLPETPPFDLTISFIPLRPSPYPLLLYTRTATDEKIDKTLGTLDLHAVEENSGGMLGFTIANPTSDVRVPALAEDAVDSDAELASPAEGSIVYLFRGGAWKAYPSIGIPARQRLQVVHDPHRPGRFRLDVTGIKLDTSYTYDPPEGPPGR
jgi:hypothetical protein